jgi:HlyD family secretion protein
MTRTLKKNPLWWAIGAAALLAAYWAYGAMNSGSEGEEIPTFPVKQGNLQINVLQGGEIRALKNYEVKSEIEYPTKIISLIPEGYLVTDEDIREGKVLVELDATEIKNKINDHDIDFQNTVSLYIEADENREIVRSENQSLVRETRNLALFALMDFEKYLGKGAASTILQAQTLPHSVDAFEKQVVALEDSAKSPKATAPAETAKPQQPQDETSAEASANEAKPKPSATVKPKLTGASARDQYVKVLAASDTTDGEAQQRLRQLNDELLLHKSELGLAKQNYEASERLASKSFITKTALENDEVSMEKVRLSVQTAETALDLFRRYEFPKQCETLLSGYQEALHKLQRTLRENRAKQAQAESKFQTAKARYDMQLARKEDLERQLKACVIRATQPGLVAYGMINSSSSARYTDAIEEGAAVRLRQTILTIPDMSQMGVHVAIHESQVKKVKLGQGAQVTVDAEPGKTLVGQVAELAILPDSSSSRYTPTLKVYPCSVHIDGAHEWLKPGMNAKVNIVVNELADVLYVPVQAIEVTNDQHYCYVNTGSDLERRELKTGAFNDEFIEVKGGLKVNEEVALSLPKLSLQDEAEADEAAANKSKARSSKPKKADKPATKEVASAK